MISVKKSAFDATKAEALRNVAAYLSKNMDVVMVYDTASAGWLSTDGHAIYIPMIPDHLVETYKKILFGGVWHETTHIRRSDFDSVKSEIPKLTAVEEALFRYLEDVRCEYHERMENPVAGNEFKMVREYLIEEEKRKLEDPNYYREVITDPNTIVWALSVALYLEAGDSDITFLPPQIQELHSKIRDDVHEFMKTSSKFKPGTMEAIKKAKEIAKKLVIKPESKMAEKGEEDSSSKDSGSGKSDKEDDSSSKDSGSGKSDKKDDSSSKDSSSSKSNKKDEKSEESEDEKSEESEDINVTVNVTEVDKIDRKPNRNDGNKKESKLKPDENGVASVTGTVADTDLKEDEPLEDLIQKAKKEGVKDLIVNMIVETDKKIKDNMRAGTKIEHVPHPLAIASDKEIVVHSSRSPVPENVKHYDKLKKELSKEIRTLRIKTESLLISKRRTHFLPDKEEGEIDTSAIYKLRNGDNLVFQQLSYTRRMNTAITILVDMSGSMQSDHKILGARKAVIACSELCHLAKIPFEILGFTTALTASNGIRVREMAGSRNMAKYNRFTPLRHYVFKQFNEGYDKAKYRLLQIQANYDNVDHESVLWAANRLAPRHERRKILIVFSDGRPQATGSDTSLLKKSLKKAVKTIIAGGIEVYGIGIYTTAVQEFYPNYSVIKKGAYTDTIASAVYRVLSKALLNTR